MISNSSNIVLHAASLTTSEVFTDDFSYWAAELPEKIGTEVEALVGPQTLSGYGLRTKRKAESKSVLNTVTTTGSGTADLSNTSERYRRIEKAILSRHRTFKWSGP